MTTIDAPYIPMVNDSVSLLVAHLVRREEVFIAARTILEPRHFSEIGEELFQFTWSRMLHHHQQYDRMPDYETLSGLVMADLTDSPLFSEADTECARSRLLWIFGLTPLGDTHADLDDDVGKDLLKRFLTERTVKKEITDQIRTTQHIGLSMTDLMAQMQGQLQAIGMIGDARSFALGEGLCEYRERLECVRNRRILGLQTGLPVLDQATMGLRGLICLCAAPNVGKSVQCIEIAIGVCRASAVNDAVVIYVSLDMPRDDVLHRVHCNLGRIDYRTYRIGSPAFRDHQTDQPFLDTDRAKIEQARNAIRDLELDRRIAVIGREDADRIDCDMILRVAERTKQNAGASNVLVIIDYLQLLPAREVGGNPFSSRSPSDRDIEHDRIRDVQRLLDGLNRNGASEQNAVLVVSEARKPSVTRQRGSNWGSKMEDLMGSARLSYAADCILMLKRVEDSQLTSIEWGEPGESAELRRQFDDRGISPLHLSIEKGRDGMVRTTGPPMVLDFHYRESRITEHEVLQSPTNARGGTRNLVRTNSADEELMRTLDVGENTAP